MAEIRSTLDMVMERAAKMAAKADNIDPTESQEKTGMRLGADYLNKKHKNLTEEIHKFEGEQRKQVITGVSKTLMRNIVLPRDEDGLSPDCLLSFQGIKELTGENEAVATTIAELQQILEQYGQHKVQVNQQLEDALRGQLQQQAMQQGIEDPGQVNPKMHPQYQEELGKMLSELNGQYNQALDERKEIIKQQLLQ